MTKTRKLIALAIIPLLSWIGICMDIPSTLHQIPVAAAEISPNQTSIQSVVTESTVDSTNNESNVISVHMPNDSYFDKQWAFNNIQIPDITSTTPEIIVAVIDTGIDEHHEDLVGKVITSINLTDSPTSSDVSGHGTHVAGIITATTIMQLESPALSPILVY